MADDVEHKLIVGGELYLYGTVGEGWYYGDSFTSKEVAEALDLMEGDITVRINSGGGIAMEGRAIFSQLKRFAGSVTVVVDSIAASAASAIAMAGNVIQMSEGAMLMIHDPRNVSYGTAADHGRNSKVLDKLADTFAQTYAKRSGMSTDEARQVMLAESWLDADEAIEQGFADEKVDDDDAEETTAHLFNYSMYAHPPEHLAAIAKAAASHFEIQPAPAKPKETKMALKPKKTPAPIPVVAETVAVIDPSVVETAVPATKMSTQDVMDVGVSAGRAGLDIQESNSIIAASASRADAMDAIIDMVADKAKPAPIATTGEMVDGRDRFVEGATRALMMKVGMSPEDGDGKTRAERNEFSGLSLMEMARRSLVVLGVKNTGMLDKMSVVGQAFMAGGGHGTSDFANILSNTASKSVLKGYLEAEETFDLWTSTGFVSDFKPTSRVDLGLFPSLLKVDEHAEYKHGTIGDSGVLVVIATYGRLINFTRQAIINDDLSLLGRVPMKMGRASKRTIGDMVYATLNDNPNFVDGVALFHADHGNIADPLGTPSETTLQNGYKAMTRQRDDEKVSKALNIRPKYALHNNYRFLFKNLLESKASTASNKNANVVNPVQALVEPIEDARIALNKWYMAADQNQVDTIEVTYLDGQKGPRIEMQPGWNIDGVETKVSMDAGVNITGVKGLYKGQ